MLHHRYGPWIAFLILVLLASSTPYFIGEMTWARGGGDIALVLLGLCILLLIWWERSLKSR